MLSCNGCCIRVLYELTMRLVILYMVTEMYSLFSLSFILLTLWHGNNFWSDSLWLILKAYVLCNREVCFLNLSEMNYIYIIVFNPMITENFQIHVYLEMYLHMEVLQKFCLLSWYLLLVESIKECITFYIILYLSTSY